jgi:hypothetical protein
VGDEDAQEEEATSEDYSAEDNFASRVDEDDE